MDIGQIEWSDWEIIQSTACKQSNVYTNGELYIKCWPIDHLDPYTTQDGLTFTFRGFDEMQSVSTGMVNTTTCPAFIDNIYDNGICCGYITKARAPVNATAAFRFIDVLIDDFTASGYLLRVVTRHNIICVNGQLSIIDIDQPPVSIDGFRSLSPNEQIVWYRLLANGSTSSHDTTDPIANYYNTKVKNVVAKWAY